MRNIELLMIGLAGIATATGCAADSPSADLDGAQAPEAERAANPDIAGSLASVFHPIKLSNTTLCLQPQGGSTADVLVELRGCNGSSAQNWQIQPRGSDGSIIVNQDGKCLYNDAPLPPSDFGQPITHQDCVIFGTPNIASNALWKPSTTIGNATLMSRVQHRDTGFCLDVPNGQPFEGATLWMFHCGRNNPAQLWRVGLD